MSSEGPKKFSGDVRSWKPFPHEFQNWEEITPDAETARAVYENIRSTLEAYGKPLTPESRMLEVGSGSGRLLSVLQEHDLNAVGVDIRPRAEGQLPIVRARIERLPFGDDAFDVVFSEKVFDGDVYNQDQIRMLEEIARVLKPTGLYFARYERMDRVPKELELLSEKQTDYIRAVYKKRA